MEKVKLKDEAAGDAAENRSDAPDQVEGAVENAAGGASPAPTPEKTEAPAAGGLEWRGNHWANTAKK
jgi:hypothetical protein